MSPFRRRWLPPCTSRSSRVASWSCLSAWSGARAWSEAARVRGESEDQVGGDDRRQAAPRRLGRAGLVSRLGDRDARAEGDLEGRISGRVLNSDGEPVANARVRLAPGNVPGGKVIRATTDRSGGFTLHGLRPGRTYTVIAEWDDRQQGLLTGRAEVAPRLTRRPASAWSAPRRGRTEPGACARQPDLGPRAVARRRRGGHGRSGERRGLATRPRGRVARPGPRSPRGGRAGGRHGPPDGRELAPRRVTDTRSAQAGSPSGRRSRARSPGCSRDEYPARTSDNRRRGRPQPAPAGSSRGGLRHPGRSLLRRPPWTGSRRPGGDGGGSWGMLGPAVNPHGRIVGRIAPGLRANTTACARRSRRRRGGGAGTGEGVRAPVAPDRVA